MTKITVNQYDAAYPVSIYTQTNEYVLCYGKQNDQDKKDFTKDILMSDPHMSKSDITLANGVIRKEYKDFYAIWFIKDCLGCKEWTSLEYTASDNALGSVEVYLGYDFTLTSPADMVLPVGGYVSYDLEHIKQQARNQPELWRPWRVAEVSRIDRDGGIVLSKHCAHCKDRRIDCVGLLAELRAGKSKCQRCTFKNEVCTAMKSKGKGKGKGKSLMSLPRDESGEAGERDGVFRGLEKRDAGTTVRRSNRNEGKMVRYTENDYEEHED